MLKNKCCLYVIISIRFFSITICNLLIEFPSYNHYHRDVQQLDCSVSTVQPTTNPTMFHKVYFFCPFGQDDMAGIVESTTNTENRKAYVIKIRNIRGRGNFGRMRILFNVVLSSSD